MKTGIELISAERQEQIEKHGRTIESDVQQNTMNELCDGARFLLLETPAQEFELDEDMIHFMIPKTWDNELFFKMYRKPYKERLIIAGALIAAEIDRLNASI